jgi:hypothetical protein
MRYKLLLLLPILLVYNCKHEIIREHFYKTGELQSKCIYPDKRDTMNFHQLDFYPSGEILRKTSIKNGKLDGEYVLYLNNGSFAERGSFLKGKIDGIFQKYDSLGRLGRVSYFIDGTRILYSEFLESKDKQLTKQRFYGVTNDTIYPIGAIVKKGDTIQKELSFYGLITGQDSIHSFDYCFKLEIFAHQSQDPKYEITFGKPNIHHMFNKVDTSFISTKDEIQICNFKLVPGLNHIFGRIIDYNDDSASFFVYKDVFVYGQKRK